MTTNTTTTYTVRMIGRCADKACRRAVRINVEQESTILAGSRMGGFDTRIRILTPGVTDHYGKRYVVCPGCGASIRLKALQVPHPDYRTKRCDARCEGATGPACDCECGGDNHGGRHAHL
jgi:hypothetical protein